MSSFYERSTERMAKNLKRVHLSEKQKDKTLYVLIAAIGIFVVFFALSPGVLLNLPSMSKDQCGKILNDADCSSDACVKCTHAAGGTHFTSPGQAAFHALVAVPLVLGIIKFVDMLLESGGRNPLSAADAGAIDSPQ